jgi:hypothetical protein
MLGKDPITGMIDRDAPFLVRGGDRRATFYDDETRVVSQMKPGEKRTRFEAGSY